MSAVLPLSLGSSELHSEVCSRLHRKRARPVLGPCQREPMPRARGYLDGLARREVKVGVNQDASVENDSAESDPVGAAGPAVGRVSAAGQH